MSKQALEYATSYQFELQKYQRQISTNLRFQRPSDDPIAFRQATSLSARLEELRTESNSISIANTKLNIAVSQLTQANEMLVQAKVLAQQGIQALSDGERQALAFEVEELLGGLKNVTKTKTGGAFLFGGTRTNRLPFEFKEPLVEGGTLDVSYFGSEFHSRSFISETVSVDSLYSGKQIFNSPQREPTLINSSTGADVGSGTDNIIGRATLQVRHTMTTYLGGSGIVAGASSPGNDTVLGPAGTHSLTIDDTSGTGAFGTISLNDGESYSYTSTDTDLKIVGGHGEIIHVDMSSITAGFSGTVDIVADGTLSVDGGLSTTAIDFSSNQTIVDSTTDRFTNINSSNIIRTGDDYLDFPGTSDAFQVLYELTQDLRNTRNLSNSDIAEALDSRLGELARASDNLLDSISQQSASLQTLDRLDDRNLDLSLEIETHLSDLQSADIPNAVLRLQNAQNLLEYTYRVTAEINSIGLIDFLR